MNLKLQHDWFPYQLISIIFLLILGCYLAINKGSVIFSVLTGLLILFFSLALSGRFIAPKKLERSIINYLNQNGGQLDRKSVENYFVINSGNDKDSGLRTANEIICRLERKRIIIIEENIIKLNV
jgi:hypothetical protein